MTTPIQPPSLPAGQPAGLHARAYVEQLNSSYFDGRLTPLVIERLSALPVARGDVRAFVERMFRLMRTSGFDARDVSVLHGEVLGSLLARLLPETWDGRVPPITVAGRHCRVDELVRRVMDREGRAGLQYLDVACGFPPLTTVETAEMFPDWQIVGLDRALPAYLVHDRDRNYAVFDEHGRTSYFQPLVPTGEAWLSLMSDWHRSRDRFEALLQTLLLEHARRGGAETHLEHDGATLDTNPVAAYERPNLHFVRGDLDAAATGSADVIRCFNMLFYFEDSFREAALGTFARVLRDDGLLLAGGNWAFSTECRYFSYRKREGRLQQAEFAFSLDNTTPLGILPWYTLHDDTREVQLLARFVGLLRADAAFRAALVEVADAMRAEYGMCPRGTDGYYQGIETVPPAEIWVRAGRISDRLCEHELGQMAADVLTAAGWPARVNEVGHIAVRMEQ